MTTLQFCILDPADIAFIIERLWERGEEEAVMYGLKSKEEMCHHLLGIAKQHGYCLKDNGEPVAAFGAANSSSTDVYTTWFIATEHFNDHGLGITKILRGFIRNEIEAHPKAQLELISSTGHPDANRWFSVLGFEWQSRNGVFSRYLYRRPAKEG